MFVAIIEEVFAYFSLLICIIDNDSQWKRGKIVFIKYLILIEFRALDF